MAFESDVRTPEQARVRPAYDTRVADEPVVLRCGDGPAPSD